MSSFWESLAAGEPLWKVLLQSGWNPATGLRAPPPSSAMAGMPSDFTYGGMGLDTSGNPLTDISGLPSPVDLPSMEPLSPLESVAAQVNVPQPKKGEEVIRPPSIGLPSLAAPPPVSQPQMPPGQDIGPIIDLLKSQLNTPNPEIKGFLLPRERAPGIFEMLNKDPEAQKMALLQLGLGLLNNPTGKGLFPQLGVAGEGALKSLQGMQAQKAKEIADERKMQIEEYQQAVAAARAQGEFQKNKATIANDVVQAVQKNETNQVNRFQAETQANYYATLAQSHAILDPATAQAHLAQATASIAEANLRNMQAANLKVDMKDPVWKESISQATAATAALSKAVSDPSSGVTANDVLGAFTKAQADYLEMRGRKDEADFLRSRTNSSASDPLGLRK